MRLHPTSRRCGSLGDNQYTARPAPCEAGSTPPGPSMRTELSAWTTSGPRGKTRGIRAQSIPPRGVAEDNQYTARPARSASPCETGSTPPGPSAHTELSAWTTSEERPKLWTSPPAIGGAVLISPSPPPGPSVSASPDDARCSDANAGQPTSHWYERERVRFQLPSDGVWRSPNGPPECSPNGVSPHPHFALVARAEKPVRIRAYSIRTSRRCGPLEDNQHTARPARSTPPGPPHSDRGRPQGPLWGSGPLTVNGTSRLDHEMPHPQRSRSRSPWAFEQYDAILRQDCPSAFLRGRIERLAPGVRAARPAAGAHHEGGVLAWRH